MIRPAELRATARLIGLPVDIVEKDYALGWILAGVVRSKPGPQLVLKGGTALSKIYYPRGWRLSEDLDFTLRRVAKLEDAALGLAEELPGLVDRLSGGFRIAARGPPHVAGEGYMQLKVRFEGPIGAGVVKIEASREDPVGPTSTRTLARSYPDYPPEKVKVYTLENIVSEKLRAMAERQRVRDYYDVWKLAKSGGVDWSIVRELLPKKCAFKGVRVTSIRDIFPRGLEAALGAYIDVGLTRLTAEPLPELGIWLSETRKIVRTELKLP